MWLSIYSVHVCVCTCGCPYTVYMCVCAHLLNTPTEEVGHASFRVYRSIYGSVRLHGKGHQ